MILLGLLGIGAVLGTAYGLALYNQKKAEQLQIQLTESQKTINQTAVLLEISIERDTEIDLKAIENMWTYFSSIADIDDKTIQPHISFELVAERDDYLKKDAIVFYLWVPKRFENMFRSRLKALYPSMIIEEAKKDFMPVIEHGVVKDNRVMAMANLGLSRHYIYSLKQLDSIKDSDPVQTLISSIAKVENKEKCIVQILLKPIDDDWKEEAKAYLKDFDLDGILPSSKLSFNDKLKLYLKNGFSALSTLLFDLLTKDSKSIVKKHNKMFELDESIDKSKIENIEINHITEKINSVGYSVEIRVLVATPLGRNRAEDKLDEICSSFRELDGDNKLVRKPVGNVIEFIKNISTRWYPIELDNDILSAKELSVLCHFPNMSKTITLKKITTKIIECPPGLSTENLLGYGYRNGLKVPVGVDFESRFRHMWIGGQTGTGKSTIMENMIINDVHNGAGLLLIDPHGESVINVIERCSTERKDIYVLDVANILYPPTINMFEIFSSDPNAREHEKNQICENFIVIFQRVFGSGAIGPNTEVTKQLQINRKVYTSI